MYDNSCYKKRMHMLSMLLVLLFCLNSGLTSYLNVNLLENIDWSNIAISGSIMACCLPNFNTIMLNQYYNNHLLCI